MIVVIIIIKRIPIHFLILVFFAVTDCHSCPLEVLHIIMIALMIIAVKITSLIETLISHQYIIH